uniref:Uncharacterized protein n=1 Tax=Picea sitchensis TaxID=3332 RepID=A9NQC8_PICSI|nr:unknown [Picea sitchensis]
MAFWQSITRKRREGSSIFHNMWRRSWNPWRNGPLCFLHGLFTGC